MSVNFWRGQASAACLVLISLILACTGGAEAPSRAVAPSPASSEAEESPTVTSKVPRRPCREPAKDHEQFVPETYRESGKVVLPVVFPEGSTAELVYPPRLKLAELGVQPAISAGIQKTGSRWVHQRFLGISKTALGELRRRDSLLKRYAGASGPVEVWRTKGSRKELYPTFLFFGIGSWNIIVGDGNVGNFMGPNNREVWAASLDGYETDNGFIVIDPLPPMALAAGPGGPDLYFFECFKFVELRLEKCRDLRDVRLAKDQTVQMVGDVTVHRNETRRQFHANWCTPSRQVSVYVDDRHKPFVDLAVRGLKVRNVDVNEDAKFAD